MTRTLAKLSDLLFLLLPIGLITALAPVFGVASSDYYRFGIVFVAFLLPGWLLSGRLVGDEGPASVTLRFVLAAFVSYCIYGWGALACRVAEWGYSAFLAWFCLATVLAAVIWWRDAKTASWSELAKKGPENTVLPLSIVLALVWFTYPYSNDQGLFDFNILQSLEERSFAPSALDVRPFGLSEPPPRMQANLFHAFFGLLGYVSDVSPLSLTFYIAPPFFGTLIFAALAVFVREVAGRRVGSVFAFAAVVLPFSAFFQGTGGAYWYEFRVLNSPTLDKDFSTFFLLPVLLWLAWTYLVGGRRLSLVAMCAALPVLVWTHPVGPVYFLIAAGALATALLRRSRVARCIALLAAALAAVLLCIALIDPSDTHPFIDALVLRDLKGGVRHFWSGHYTMAKGNPISGVVYCCGDHALLRPSRYFGSALIQRSLELTLVWVALLLLRFVWIHRRSAGAWREGAGALLPAGLGIAGVCLGSVAALRLASLGDAASLAPLWLAGILALPALPLIVLWSWREGESDSSWAFGADEARALRLQGVYVALLVLMYLASSIALNYELSLARGLERLSWMYFGFFSIAFVGASLWAALREGLLRMVGPERSRTTAWLRRGVRAVPVILLAALVGDQAGAFLQSRGTTLHRLGLGESAIDGWWRLERDGGRWVRRMHGYQGERGAAAPLEKPDWLRTEDSVLLPVSYTPYRHKYALMKQAAHYRELYSEAFALQHLGPDFLVRFDAYNDYLAGRATPRVVSWLEERGVTIVAWPAPGFIASLQQVWPHRIRKIDKGVFRIR